jgi:2'-5' RNA ligase
MSSATTKKSGGTYHAVEFSKESVKKINEILKDFGLEKDFTDSFHCTLTYSKKKIPFLKTSKNMKQVKGAVENGLNILVSIKEFGHFDTPEGKNLHVVLNCPMCEQQFNKAIKQGGTFDYDAYTPHVTLMYDCGEFDIKKQNKLCEKYIGEKLSISKEYIKPLNKEWLDENKKETK